MVVVGGSVVVGIVIIGVTNVVGVINTIGFLFFGWVVLELLLASAQTKRDKHIANDRATTIVVLTSSWLFLIARSFFQERKSLRLLVSVFED